MCWFVILSIWCTHHHAALAVGAQQAHDDEGSEGIQPGRRLIQKQQAGIRDGATALRYASAEE